MSLKKDYEQDTNRKISFEKFANYMYTQTVHYSHKPIPVSTYRKDDGTRVSSHRRSRARMR